MTGSAPVRSPNELSGCSAAQPDSNPNTALFRIEVIQVPLAHPEQAHIVSSPRIFQDLTQAKSHPEAPEDVAEAKREADSARAAGGYTATITREGVATDIILGPNFLRFRLDSIVKARGGTGTPTAADTATLRANLQNIVDLIVQGPPRPPGTPRPGPTQCHDITVYPAIGMAGGACGGYGLLLDIRDVANPTRGAAVYSRAAARPTSRSGVRTPSSRVPAVRWTSRATTSSPSRRRRSRSASRTTGP